MLQINCPRKNSNFDAGRRNYWTNNRNRFVTPAINAINDKTTYEDSMSDVSEIDYNFHSKTELDNVKNIETDKEVVCAAQISKMKKSSKKNAQESESLVNKYVDFVEGKRSKPEEEVDWNIVQSTKKTNKPIVTARLEEKNQKY